MIRWLCLCVACIAVYWLPVLTGPASGVWFFVANSSWSFSLCIMVLAISRSKTALSLVTLESCAIALNLICLYQYLTARVWLYSVYGDVIDMIVAAEIAVLVMGAPWDGIRRMVHQRGRSSLNRSPAYLRNPLDNQEVKQ